MTMILTIFLLLSVCASICAAQEEEEEEEETPYFHDMQQDFDIAWETLKNNILSMDVGAPELDDPRRQFAEIFSVIYYGALYKKDCYIEDYKRAYEHILYKYAPNAMTNPKIIIDGTRKLFSEYFKKTKLMQRLVTELCPEPRTPAKTRKCDREIGLLVNLNPNRYGTECRIFLAGTATAKALNELKSEFEEVLNERRAHEYVLNGVDRLENVTVKLADFLSVLFPGVSHVFCETL